MPISRVKFTGLTLGGTLYDVVTIYRGNECEQFRKALQNALQSKLQLQAHYESKTVDVIVLSGTPIGPESQAPYGKIELSAAGIEAEGITTEDLASALETHFDKPVIDESQFGERRFNISAYGEGQMSVDNLMMYWDTLA